MQIAEFSKLDVADKYRLFLYGNQKVHPPALYLSDAFARDPVVVHYLSEKLRGDVDWLTVRDIVAVLSDVKYMGLYDFCRDAELINLLDRKIKHVPEPWYELVSKMVNEIKSEKTCGAATP